MDSEIGSLPEIKTAVLDKIDSIEELKTIQYTSNSLVPISELSQLSEEEVKEVIQRKSKRQEYVDELKNVYIEKLGAQEDLRFALMKSSDKKAQNLLESLLDPRNGEKSFTRLASQSGLGLIDLLALIKDYYVQEGMIQYMKAYPEVAADIAQDARTVTEGCPKCDGDGTITLKKAQKLITCPRCKGSKVIRVPGDPEARKLMHEAMGITRRGGGVNVNIANVAGGYKGVECVIDEVEGLESHSLTNRRSTAPPIIDVEPL